MVVVKILVNSELSKEEFGAQIYENNFDGECVVQDDFHCVAEVDGRDTIFGTNEENVTIKIPLTRILAEQVVDDARTRGEDTLTCAQNRINEFMWRVADLANAMLEDETQHGCWDCGHYDGSTCVHIGSHNYGHDNNVCAEDCEFWDNGE